MEQSTSDCKVKKEKNLWRGVCTAYIRDLSLHIPAKPTEILSEVDKLTVTVQENNRKLSHTRRQHNQLELLLRLDPHANGLRLASAIQVQVKEHAHNKITALQQD